MTKAGRSYEIPCEDTPEGSIAVWLHAVGLETRLEQDLVVALVEWAESFKRACRIYETRDSYLSITAGGGAQQFI